MQAPPRDRWFAALLALWGVFAVASIWLRPLWPVDETRYASVAWEMWLRGDLLVPYVNGEPYSHKPPLLFWLMHLGWAVFGVNDWWPRLVGPFCALGVLALQQRLARLLWPEDADSRAMAAWVLCGTLLFAAMATLTMFDLLLALCVMIGMIGVVRAAHGERRAGFLWLGAGIGLGVLAKGPVILLHLLPVALVAPWWAPGARAAPARWYASVAAAVLLGAAIALAWALPAGYFGGEVYRRAIFWGQTAGRVSESFAHRAPFWYYLPLLPAILFPWLIWPALWRGLRAESFSVRDPGNRFLIAWLALTLVVFTLVSGKQAKYLVPTLPAFALLAGIALARLPVPARRWEMLLPACGFLALPALFAYVRANPAAFALPPWASALPFWPAAALALALPVLVWLGGRSTVVQARALAFAICGAFVAFGAGIVPAIAVYADPRPAAAHLAELQRQATPLAHLGKYHAQYNFVGRLEQSIEILDNPELASWVAAHPAGQVIVVERNRHAGGDRRPEYETPFRGAWIQVWRGEALLLERGAAR
ncbi:MAG: glycosyltransferase family 39 protein [Betaproteobacteria bacterium]|nr:MAG: glycosyltransferase family 39 protein [Betaproteobacteria bacterium]